MSYKDILAPVFVAVSLISLANAQNPIVDPDRFPGYTFSQMKPHLDNFANLLKDKPDSQGYIFIYGELHACPDEVKKRIAVTKIYLKKKGLKDTQIKIIDGGIREKTETELFIKERDWPAPSPSPMINSGDKKVYSSDNCRKYKSHRITRSSK